MRSFRQKPIGWCNESYRHYLAAKGVKTRYLAERFSAWDAEIDADDRAGEYEKLLAEARAEKEEIDRDAQALAEARGGDVDEWRKRIRRSKWETSKSEGKIKQNKERLTISERSKKQWEDPEYRKMMSERAKKQWEDPEYRKMMSERTKKMWDDPAFRDKVECARDKGRATAAGVKSGLSGVRKDAVSDVLTGVVDEDYPGMKLKTGVRRVTDSFYAVKR